MPKNTSAGLVALALATLVVVLYLPSLNSAFHFDDEINITARNAIHIESLNLDSLTRAVTDALLPSRVLPNLSFAIDWWRGGGSPRPFQWTNILIHGANAALLFLLAVLIFRQRLSGTPRNRMVLGTAFMVALIWALHPIQIQAVSYIVQRMASMAAFFSLFTVLCYLRGRLNGGWYWYLFSLIGFGLGALSKENAWIAPALIWLAEFGVVRHQRPLLPSKIVKLLFALPFIVFLWVTLDLISGVGPWSQYLLGGYADRDFTLTERLLTQPRVIVFHFSQLLWPLPGRFSIEHDFVLSTGLLTPPQTLAALAAVFGWCALGLWALCQQSYRLQCFLLLWVPVTLAIESSVVPLEMVFEHRMYMPTLGLALLIGLGMLDLQRRTKRLQQSALAAALVVIVLLGVSTHLRLPVWSSLRSLYELAALHAPERPRVWSLLGQAYREQGDREKALKAYSRALELNRREPLAAVNRATLLVEMGLYRQALADFRLAILDSPEDAGIFNNLGIVYAILGESQSAIESFRESLRLDPDYADAQYNLASQYKDQRQYPQAQALIESALNKLPDKAKYRTLLAEIQMRRGRLDDALTGLNQVLSQYPEQVSARFFRSLILAQLGRFAESLADVGLVLSQRPEYDAALLHRGRLLRQSGNLNSARSDFELACILGSERACTESAAAGSRKQNSR